MEITKSILLAGIALVFVGQLFKEWFVEITPYHVLNIFLLTFLFFLQELAVYLLCKHLTVFDVFLTPGRKVYAPAYVENTSRLFFSLAVTMFFFQLHLDTDMYKAPPSLERLKDTVFTGMTIYLGAVGAIIPLLWGVGNWLRGALSALYKQELELYYYKANQKWRAYRRRLALAAVVSTCLSVHAWMGMEKR